VIAISGLGAWIAFKQVKIATAKLNLDLYDRRFKIEKGEKEYSVRPIEPDIIEAMNLNDAIATHASTRRGAGAAEFR